MVSIGDHHHDGEVSSLYIHIVDGFGYKLYFSRLGEP